MTGKWVHVAVVRTTRWLPAAANHGPFFGASYQASPPLLPPPPARASVGQQPPAPAPLAASQPTVSKSPRLDCHFSLLAVLTKTKTLDTLHSRPSVAGLHSLSSLGPCTPLATLPAPPVCHTAVSRFCRLCERARDCFRRDCRVAQRVLRGRGGCRSCGFRCGSRCVGCKTYGAGGQYNRREKCLKGD